MAGGALGIVVRCTGVEQPSAKTAALHTSTSTARLIGDLSRAEIRAMPKPASTASENPTRITANAGIRSARYSGTWSYRNLYSGAWNPSVRLNANPNPRAYNARVGDTGGHRATIARETATSPGNNFRSGAPKRSADHPYRWLLAGVAR